MNSTIDLLKRHCSIRKFTAEKISQDVLQELVRAGQHASTSSFIQSVSVINVVNPEIRQTMVDYTGGQPYVASASHFLVFCADLNRNRARVKNLGFSADYGWTEQFLSASLDVALFAQNVVVAAESMQIGACYIGGIRNNPEGVSKLLKLPNLVYPVFGLCLGFAAQDPMPKPRLPLDVVLHEDSYDCSELVEAQLDQYDKTVKDYYQERTGGKLRMTFSQQMKKQCETQSRPFMQEFLRTRGFMQK